MRWTDPDGRVWDLVEVFCDGRTTITGEATHQRITVATMRRPPFDGERQPGWQLHAASIFDPRGGMVSTVWTDTREHAPAIELNERLKEVRREFRRDFSKAPEFPRWYRKWRVRCDRCGINIDVRGGAGLTATERVWAAEAVPNVLERTTAPPTVAVTVRLFGYILGAIR